MNKEDIEELKVIVQQAKKLEELISEIEGPLTDRQKENLSHEFFCMGAVSVRPIDDVVSRIDSALHHPEEYINPEPEPPFDGSVETVYANLCIIRDQWNALFQNKQINEFKVYLIFSRWVNEIYKYTEHICCKYNLELNSIRIGSTRMWRALGTCCKRGVVYNRRLIICPSWTLNTILHEICHLKYLDHSRYFWQFYEDVCINEGFLLKRVLGNKNSFRDIEELIPYKWELDLKYFSNEEINAIEMWMKQCKSFKKIFKNKIQQGA